MVCVHKLGGRSLYTVNARDQTNTRVPASLPQSLPQIQTPQMMDLSGGRRSIKKKNTDTQPLAASLVSVVPVAYFAFILLSNMHTHESYFSCRAPIELHVGLHYRRSVFTLKTI